jgi:hypothetical protein
MTGRPPTLLFGVDYRYVTAPYIDKSCTLGPIQLPTRHRGSEFALDRHSNQANF